MKSFLTPLAKNLRSRSTDAERKLWSLLRAHRLSGFKFRRQQPVGPYIVDFLCKGKGLVVELDGGQHAVDGKDAERDTFLEAHGFRVIRFWNDRVLKQPEVVAEEILRVVEGLPPLPHPLPRGEGGKPKR